MGLVPRRPPGLALRLARPGLRRTPEVVSWRIGLGMRVPRGLPAVGRLAFSVSKCLRLTPIDEFIIALTLSLSLLIPSGLGWRFRMPVDMPEAFIGLVLDRLPSPKSLFMSGFKLRAEVFLARTLVPVVSFGFLILKSMSASSYSTGTSG